VSNDRIRLKAKDRHLWGAFEGDMLRQLLFGGAISLINIGLHAMVMTIVIRVAQSAGAVTKSQSALFLIAVMIPTVSVLMLAHALEVIVWSLAYSIVDAAPAAANLVYFAFVNYTTLGYGDVVPVDRWRLLGPITAMNGVLLFGWSTAVIFEVLRKTLARFERA
jgi:Ion channel